MSESNEATTTEEPEVYEPKTAAEEKAMDRGWVPEHLFSGEKEDWVDAKEFNYRGQLMDEISKRTRHNKKLEETVHKFKVYMDNMEQKAYERAKEELLIEKAEALNEGDTLKAVQKDEELKQLDQQINQPSAVQPNVDEWNSEYDIWVKDNSWYESDKAMAAYANSVVSEYVQQHPYSTPREAYAYVSQEVKKEFPHKLKNTRRSKSGTVAPSNTSGNTSTRGRVNLTAEERKAADVFIAEGLFKDYDEYAKELQGLE